jgi:hypothetical protein
MASFDRSSGRFGSDEDNVLVPEVLMPSPYCAQRVTSPLPPLASRGHIEALRIMRDRPSYRKRFHGRSFPTAYDKSAFFQASVPYIKAAGST